jgi:hypothetical protein
MTPAFDSHLFVCCFLFICKCVLLPPKSASVQSINSIITFIFLLSVSFFGLVNGIGLSLLHIWMN